MAITADDAEEYTQSLGQIVAGSWRQIAWAQRQGIPQALGLSTQDWVEERLGGYVRLSIPERREAVRELVAEGMSQRQIGEVLGVGQPTVSRDADSFESDERCSAWSDDSDESLEQNAETLAYYREQQAAYTEAARIDDEVTNALNHLVDIAEFDPDIWLKDLGRDGSAGFIRDRLRGVIPAVRETLDRLEANL